MGWYESMKRKPRYEVWALHEKVGKQPWRLASWFTPRIEDDRNSFRAEEEVKTLAKRLSDRFRRYRAVRYTPEWRTTAG